MGRSKTRDFSFSHFCENHHGYQYYRKCDYSANSRILSQKKSAKWFQGKIKKNIKKRRKNVSKFSLVFIIISEITKKKSLKKQFGIYYKAIASIGIDYKDKKQTIFSFLLPKKNPPKSMQKQVKK